MISLHNMEYMHITSLSWYGLIILNTLCQIQLYIKLKGYDPQTDEPRDY